MIGTGSCVLPAAPFALKFSGYFASGTIQQSSLSLPRLEDASRFTDSGIRGLVARVFLAFAFLIRDDATSDNFIWKIEVSKCPVEFYEHLFAD